MEQNNSKLSPKTLGLLAAACCFLVLSLTYFFFVGKGLIAGDNSENEEFVETNDYMTDDDWDDLANEGNADEDVEY